MSVNYFRGSSTFFVSYANDDDSDAFVGHFIYHVDGEHDYYPDTGKIKIAKGFCVIGKWDIKTIQKTTILFTFQIR